MRRRRNGTASTLVALLAISGEIEAAESKATESDATDSSAGRPAAGLRLAQLDSEEPTAAPDVTESVPSSNEDITESLETPTTPAAPPADAPPATEPVKESRVQLSGYARESVELDYGELSREATDTTAPLLWRDVFLSRTQLVIRASYVESRHFEATVSGVLDYTMHVAKQAPQYSEHVVDLLRGDLDPRLREAYLGFFWPSVDLRIGQQRVAWGRADFQSPNDVINARDLRDPFLGENELRYLPTPVVRATISGGSVSFETVASPFFVPDRYDVYGTNWSVLQYRAPQRYKEVVGTTSTLVDASIERELAALWHDSERPKDNGKGASIGARFSASFSGADLNAYYHYGYDGTPYVTFHPDFVTYLNMPDLPMGTPARLDPVLDLVENDQTPVTARYLRRHHAGFDVATGIGSFALRFDAAYESRRVFYRADLTSFASPALLGVASLEYQTGNLDELVLFEVLACHLTKDPSLPNEQGMLPQPLLGYDRNTVAVAGNLRFSLGDSWGIDLRGLVGITPSSYALQPALRFKPTDSFSMRLGALIVTGEERSLGWYYGDNDTAFVQFRYAF